MHYQTVHEENKLDKALTKEIADKLIFNRQFIVVPREEYLKAITQLHNYGPKYINLAIKYAALYGQLGLIIYMAEQVIKPRKELLSFVEKYSKNQANILKILWEPYKDQWM